MRRVNSLRVAAVLATSLALSSCADEPAMVADGLVSFPGRTVDLTRSVRVDTQFASQIAVEVSTDDRTETLFVMFDTESGNLLQCSGLGYVVAAIRYTRADGTVFTGSPSDGGDCTLSLTSGTDGGRDWMSVTLSGTLISTGGAETLELRSGYVTIHNLVQ